VEINLDSGRLAVFVGGLFLFLLVETLRPARAWARPRWQRFALHASIATLNTFVIRLLVYVPFLLWTVYVEEEGWGISRWLGLVGWTEIIVSIIVLDAFDYFWHRANHRLRFLWRFHKAHHSDVGMDVTTSLRFHPGELIISGLVKALWILIWGPTVVAWFLFEAMVSLSAQFHHSNIDFPDRVERWLSLLVVTPRYHAAHHAVDRHWGNANFSTILSIWDRLFGTYSRPADGGATTNGADALGLPEGRRIAYSPFALLSEPFRRRNLGLASAESASSGGNTSPPASAG
jgi:sterol desaturase/sphingolipid hydroxylase (fatty acid hydroxylase superfamily)